jgi:hypothetical protein
MQPVPERRRKPLQRMSEHRKQVFLETMRQTGSFRAASAMASPHCKTTDVHPAPGAASFRDLMKRDPLFADQVREAREHALGRAEALLSERMLEPDTRPIFNRAGELLGVQRDHRNCNTLLLRFLERHDADWAPKKHIDGRMQHEHANVSLGEGGMSYVLQARDILALPEHERAEFMRMLETIEGARGGGVEVVSGGARPKALPAGDEAGGGPRD